MVSGCLPALTTGQRLPAYRTPWLTLAYPARDASVPADRPLVVFRFSAGEADDPVDPMSFRVTVDGIDRTTLFRVSAGEAWALLADSAAGLVATAGPHALSARVCSVRGACVRLDATLVIGQPATSAPR